MTLLGKIFTVLIFVMSVAFMMIAMCVYATHRNWRDLVENSEAATGKPLGLRLQLEREKEEVSKKQKELEELQNKLAMERAARRQALAALESHLKLSREDLVALAQKNATLVETQSKAIATMESTHTNLSRLNEEVVVLRGEIRTTQLDRDTKFQEVVALTDQVHQAHGVKRRLEERQVQLAGQVGKMKNVLNKNGLNENSPVDGKAPKLDGIVLAVSTKSKLVEISIGSDEGLQEGHFLEVTRGRSYLGRIVIRRASPDRAVGEILPDFSKGLIQKGDRVYTKV